MDVCFRYFLVFLNMFCCNIIDMSYVNIDKNKLEDYEKTRRFLLQEIKPTSKQLIQERKLLDSILKKIKKMPGKHITAVVAGSFGKGTQLKDSKDFDIFVLYPPTLPREEFVREGLNVGQNVFKGYFWEKKYSEHPYISGIIDGQRIEIVPAYKIESTDNLLSSVDRTLFHLMFVNKNISDKQRDDVRLLKYFMKYIGTYGADSSTFGFSGYLCELLVLYYKDFLNVLTNVANWNIPVKLALLQEQFPFLDKFNDPLVFIDPVDSNRNVAAAVSEKQLCVFIAASREFLYAPYSEFFKKQPKSFSYNQLLVHLSRLPMVILKFNVKDMLKDIVWAKLRKNTNKLIKYLESEGFKVLKFENYYYDGEDNAFLFLLVDSLQLSKFTIGQGPLVTDINASENFIRNTSPLYGPYIRDNKWYIIKQRDEVNISDIILDFAKTSFDLDVIVLVDDEIKSFYLENTSKLNNFFSDFFLPKEKFLL